MSRTLAIRSRRSAFTLVELMVVMVIIAILVGLLLSAVQKARIRVKQVQAVNDIQQLSTAIETFKSRYEVNYMPSRFRLRNNISAYNNPIDPLDVDSLAFLKRMWPRLTTGVVNWMPDDPAASPNSVYYLEGDQCLVFFLGGLQQNGGTTGFRTDKSNPTNLAAPADAPLYDFPTARLALAAPGQGGPNSRPPNVGLSYFDSYAAMPPSQGNDPKCRPYIYFTSQNGNDYCKYNLPTGFSDCASILQIPPGNDAYPAGVNASVFPYAESQTKFLNANSFQIFCAGRSRAFGGGQSGGPVAVNNSGVGVVWSPTAGYGDLQPGSDNMSNFSKKLLSEPTN
jgi:prepilin-type N-terminal cleavage/methylation domain-containing protein